MYFDQMCYLNDANFRYEDGRVIMGPLGNRTCAVTINPVLYKDEGNWNITIEFGEGESKTSVEYSHNISVTTQG